MNASWVAIDLMEFAVRTEDAVQSPEAALEWLRSFRDTLLMEGTPGRCPGRLNCSAWPTSR